jgi:hypothetical protein
VSRTRILVALLVLVVLLELFPERSTLIKGVAVSVGALYALAWGGARFFAQYRRNSAQAAQQAADETEYREYKMELDRIRARHDPDRNLDEPTSIPPAYRDELTALHDKHEAMLTRKFGAR